MARTEYPTKLTEVELIELAHALGFHFQSSSPACDPDYSDQYQIVCTVVQRMLNRRAGLI